MFREAARLEEECKGFSWIDFLVSCNITKFWDWLEYCVNAIPV
jgi:hypothetical protein